jgi:hypothetical protein
MMSNVWGGGGGGEEHQLVEVSMDVWLTDDHVGGWEIGGACGGLKAARPLPFGW